MPADDHRLDLRPLLEAIGDASPVAVIDVLAAELGRMVDATAVQLLLANYSGDAVVRMSHVALDADRRVDRNERTESFPLAGSTYERVLLAQELASGRATTAGTCSCRSPSGATPSACCS